MDNGRNSDQGYGSQGCCFIPSLYTLFSTKLEDSKAVLDEIYDFSIVWIGRFGKAQQVSDLEQIDLTVDPFLELLCQSQIFLDDQIRRRILEAHL